MTAAQHSHNLNCYRTRAIRKAAQTGEPMAVITIDEPPYGRAWLVVEESYLDDPEYAAFGGYCELIAYPDGDTE